MLLVGATDGSTSASQPNRVELNREGRAPPQSNRTADDAEIVPPKSIAPPYNCYEQPPYCRWTSVPRRLTFQPLNSLQNIAISASAGSGKTYTLTNRFIYLLHAFEQGSNSIVTFIGNR